MHMPTISLLITREDASIRSHIYLFVFPHSSGLRRVPYMCTNRLLVYYDYHNIYTHTHILLALRATVNSEEFGVLKSFQTLDL